MKVVKFYKYASFQVLFAFFERKGEHISFKVETWAAIMLSGHVSIHLHGQNFSKGICNNTYSKMFIFGINTRNIFKSESCGKMDG